MSLSFPVDATLKDGSPVQLVLEDEQDDFMDYWLRGLFLSAIADRMVDKHWVFQ
jgi:hypothetical protein